MDCENDKAAETFARMLVGYVLGVMRDEVGDEPISPAVRLEAAKWAMEHGWPEQAQASE